MLKSPTNMKEILCRINLADISRQVFPFSLLDVSADSARGNANDADDDGGWIRND
jgi:hypothetical protein